MEYVETNHSPSDTSDCQAAMNIAVAKAFMAGAEWADEHPSQQVVARELSRLGYTITLNGDIISKEEENEMTENYVKYQKERLVEKACDWLEATMQGTMHPSAIAHTIKQFRKMMEE